MDRTVYFCENVSSIEVSGGLVYLTDKSGDIEICRAMEWPTFINCLDGAMELRRRVELERGCNIVDFPARAGP